MEALTESSGSAREGTRYRDIFEAAPLALWLEDFSGVENLLDALRNEGVTDIRAYFHAYPDRLAEAVRAVRIVEVNAFSLEMFDAESKEILSHSLADIFIPETSGAFIEELAALWDGRARYSGETALQTLKGRRIEVAFTVTFKSEHQEHTLVAIIDITARKEAERQVRRQSRRSEALHEIARAIASDLNIERIVQTVTDSATELSGAKFGAFFYNPADAASGSYTRFTLSGAPREAFEKFGLPRSTAIFGPTFEGKAVVRSDDIRLDPRFGHNPPHFGMPKGHLPVVSYLAVPVISRSGEVHGGLFFGHDKPGVFTQDSARIVEAIAAHAAVALDNSKLLELAKAEVEHRRKQNETAQRYAAIVESSDDAILTKDLDTIITSWNKSAERIFGYTAEEAIGKSVTMLIPADRQDEEPSILSRIRAGERVDHYETVRQRKDGTLLDISLTVSPLKDSEGRIVGASKIARDITEQKRAQAQRELLMREMNHRIKNLFALAGSVVNLSARNAESAEALKKSVLSRLHALSQAHALTMKPDLELGARPEAVSLHSLIRAIVLPYEREPGAVRAIISGDDLDLSPASVTAFALLLHEFATNAAKYGALSSGEGSLEIHCQVGAGRLRVTWIEQGGPSVKRQVTSEGFGTMLTRASAQSLGGEVAYEWAEAGVTIVLDCSLERIRTA
jgi:PAS domain S-box-containing protein